VALGIGRFSVGVAAGLSDPDPAARAHDRIQGGHHTAGRGNALDASTVIPMLIGLAVGEENELVIAQLRADQVLQCVFVPHGSTSQLGRDMGCFNSGPSPP
jgi:hypothetical protein